MILKIVFPVAVNTALRLHGACVSIGRTIADLTCLDFITGPTILKIGLLF